MADPCLMIDRVASPVRAELPEQIGRLVCHLGGTDHVYRVRPGFLPHKRHLGGNLVNRLFPRQPLPLTSCQLERISKPAIAMHDLPDRSPFRAMSSAIDRAFPGRLLTGPNAILDFGND